jgi:hypothetical protein
MIVQVAHLIVVTRGRCSALGQVRETRDCCPDILDPAAVVALLYDQFSSDLRSLHVDAAIDSTSRKQ